MVALLDVNVLVALAWPNHIHHVSALTWFEEHCKDGWATCPLTESGFVRISSNQRVIPAAKSPSETIALLERMVALPGHHFWADDISIAKTDLIAKEKLLGYRQVTDAHLVALAARHSGHVVTFDRGLLDIVPRGQQADELVKPLS